MKSMVVKAKSLFNKAVDKVMSFDKDEAGLVGLIDVAIILLVLVAVFYVASLVGDKFESNSALQLSNTSQWNSTVNSKIVSGRSVWESNAGLVTLAITIFILGIVVGYVIDLGGFRTGRGGGQAGGQ